MRSERETDLLQIEGLTVDFHDRRHGKLRALEGVDLAIGEGQAVGLVGESGSGKTVLAHSILGLLPSNGWVVDGQVRWRGCDLLEWSEAQLRQIRGSEIAMIFQDPQTSLNPVYRVGHQIEWVLALHRGIRGSAAKAEVLSLFDAVQLGDPERCYRSYPHELSGGMCQRTMVAMALACRPKLLIADEPTSALDLTIQAEILALLKAIRSKYGMALLFISHDLRAVANLCERVAVIFRGKIVESGASGALFSSPAHEFTRRLVESAAGGAVLQAWAAGRS